MPRKVIDIDYTRCTGCRACVLACALAHSGVIRISASAIQVVSSLDGGVNVPLICTDCEERSCISVCPVHAIQINEALGFPVIHAEECVGCKACVSACPYHAITFDPVTNKAIKCDLCHGSPLCVEVCSAVNDMPGALHFITLGNKEEEERYDQRMKERMNGYQQIAKGE